MDNDENTPTEDPVGESLKSLKRAMNRAKHARFQLNRYPNSDGAHTYRSNTKQELKKAYDDLGVLLYDEKLI